MCWLWRRERDSNPRVVSHKLISSQPRYDRFDISPYMLNSIWSVTAIQFESYCLPIANNAINEVYYITLFQNNQGVFEKYFDFFKKTRIDSDYYEKRWEELLSIEKT